MADGEKQNKVINCTLDQKIEDVRTMTGFRYTRVSTWALGILNFDDWVKHDQLSNLIVPFWQVDEFKTDKFILSGEVGKIWDWNFTGEIDEAGTSGATMNYDWLGLQLD